MKVSDYFDKREKFEILIKNFFEYLCDNELEIYNEFSFQHELGIYFRNKFKEDCEDFNEYKIEFERNAKKHFKIIYNSWEKIKKEIDIVIYKKDHSMQYAIELKFPSNNQYPEQMFNFVKDVRFMQELVNQKKFQKTYCITLIYGNHKGSPFFEGIHEGRYGADIYKYFREGREERVLLTGKILKPTGRNKYIIDLKDKEYPFSWENCQILTGFKRAEFKYMPCKYYIIECK